MAMKKFHHCTVGNLGAKLGLNFSKHVTNVLCHQCSHVCWSSAMQLGLCMEFTHQGFRIFCDATWMTYSGAPYFCCGYSSACVAFNIVTQSHAVKLIKGHSNGLSWSPNWCPMCTCMKQLLSFCLSVSLSVGKIKLSWSAKKAFKVLFNMWPH